MDKDKKLMATLPRLTLYNQDDEEEDAEEEDDVFSIATMATMGSTVSGKSLTETYNYTHKSVVELEETNYRTFGFLNPRTVKLSSAGDWIKEGDERVCFVSVIYGSDELYLIFSDEYPENVNKFIRSTQDLYHSKVWSTTRRALFPKPDMLIPGAIVCVYHQEERTNEWKRAKIVEKLDDPSNDTDFCYKVQLLDLGEYHTISNKPNLLYLHHEIVARPKYAIKARLDVEIQRTELSYVSNEEWNLKFREMYLSYGFNEKVRVKFVRRERLNNENIWLVSLLRFENPKIPKPDINDRYSIEDQISCMVNNLYPIIPRQEEEDDTDGIYIHEAE